MIGNYLKTHKHIPAIAAALGMTLIMGLAILGVGVNALLNPNTQPVLASSGSVESASTALTAADNTQHVQELLAQYQAREQQYKTELQQAATQLNMANRQLSQYQSLINGLENAGVIQISPDGRVHISGGRFRNDDGD